MAISERSSSNDPKTSASTTHTVTKPTGATTGDVLYAQIITNGATINSEPGDGWTQLSAGTAQANPKFYLYRLIVTSGHSGTSSWNWGLSSSVTSGSICTCLTGADTTTPENTSVATGNNSTGSNNCNTSAGFTTTVNGCRIIYGFGVNSSTNALTKPSDNEGITGVWTEIAEVGARKNEMDWIDQTTAGAVAAVGGSAASNSLAWYAHMVAVAPATAAAASSAALRRRPKQYAWNRRRW